MREQKRSATYINIHIRAVNPFLNWLHTEEHVTKRLKLKQVPNPQKPLRAITDKEVALVLAFRPVWRNSFRTWSLIQLLLDTGLRIDEATNAKLSELDMDNLQMRVLGKATR
jgi:integrase/recombinase XerD